MAIETTSDLSLVGTSQIVDGSVTSAKIGAGAVGSATLADNAVVAAKINAGAVGSAALASGAVVAAAIAAGAVGSAALADNAVVSSKINSGAATSGQILQANGSGGVAFSTPAASGSSWVKVIDQKNGTALGITSGPYAVTNVATGSLRATISGSAKTLSVGSIIRISATSEISSIGQSGADFSAKTASVGDGFPNYAASAGAGLYLVAGYLGTVYTSPDLTTWTNRTSGVGNRNIFSIAPYTGGYFVLGSEGGYFSYSTDGATWTAGENASIGDTKAIATNGSNNWVRAGNLKVLYGGPSSWTEVSTSVAANAAAFGNSTYLIAGNSGSVATATAASAGSSWTNRTSGFGTTAIYSATYGNGLFVIGGDGGKISTSPDGITWTSISAGFSTARRIQGLHYQDPYFIAVADGGVTRASKDGSTWTGISGLSSGNGYAVASSDTLVFMTGDSRRVSSSAIGLSEVLFTPISYSTVS